MPDKPDTKRDPVASGNPKVHSPSQMGGSSVQNAEGKGSGSHGATPAHKRNPGSGARS